MRRFHCRSRDCACASASRSTARRPRDIADIEGIVECVPNLDLTRVRANLSQLSAALEGEDHLARLESIIHHVHRVGCLGVGCETRETLTPKAKGRRSTDAADHCLDVVPVGIRAHF